MPASDYVKLLTGVSDARLDAIYDRVCDQLLYKLRETGATDTVPEELEHIVDEITIARFNIVGSEGFKSESVEGLSVTFDKVTFDKYRREIEEYIADQQGEVPTPGGIVVRFL